MKKNVLGVRIDDINMEKALQTVEQWVWNPGKHFIVTPNPEILVAAQDDIEFKEILNKADLAIPDGAGLIWSGKIKNTLPGTDLMIQLVKLCSEKAFTIALLGGGEGVAEKTKDCLERQYQNISIVFASDGGRINSLGEQSDGRAIKIPPVDILFVAFGHIKQEKWIAKNIKNTPAKVIMAVGGAFDYISGKIPRAPHAIRSLGFEWLFRLIFQPWRIKRQLAIPKYLWLLTRSR